MTGLGELPLVVQRTGERLLLFDPHFDACWTADLPDPSMTARFGAPAPPCGSADGPVGAAERLPVPLLRIEAPPRVHEAILAALGPRRYTRPDDVDLVVRVREREAVPALRGLVHSCGCSPYGVILSGGSGTTLTAPGFRADLRVKGSPWTLDAWHRADALEQFPLLLKALLDLFALHAELRRSALGLHAAALHDASGVVLVHGDSGVGKSTFVLAALEADAALNFMADELVLVHLPGPSATAVSRVAALPGDDHPLAARGMIPVAVSASAPGPPELRRRLMLSDGPTSRPSPVRACFHLRRVTSRRAECRPLSPDQSWLRLMRQLYRHHRAVPTDLRTNSADWRNWASNMLWSLASVVPQFDLFVPQGDPAAAWKAARDAIDAGTQLSASNGHGR